MLIPRISKQRAEAIAARLKEIDLLKGGKIMLQRGAGITEGVWYRALAGAQITEENAIKIENHLGIKWEEHGPECNEVGAGTSKDGCLSQ